MKVLFSLSLQKTLVPFCKELRWIYDQLILQIISILSCFRVHRCERGWKETFSGTPPRKVLAKLKTIKDMPKLT